MRIDKTAPVVPTRDFVERKLVDWGDIPPRRSPATPRGAPDPARIFGWSDRTCTWGAGERAGKL